MKKRVIARFALCAAVLAALFAACAGKQGLSAPPEQGQDGAPGATAKKQSSGRGSMDGPADESEKLSVAVYMAGEELAGIKGAYKILGGELARAISGSDKYIAVNRTDAILEILGQEHVYQRSGAVTDEQIMDLGKQVGAQYLCIAEISEVKGGTYYLDVRLVDVVTAKTASSATAGSNLADINEMIRVAQELARELIGVKGVAREEGRPGAPGSGPIYADDAKPVSRVDGADFLDDKIGVDMVFVRGGAFTMGCTPEQTSCYDTEKPAHRAVVSDFYICKYPVTQKLWQSVMGTNPSDTKGDALPVHNINWDEAQEFIAKIKKMTGRKYRLPTEAEWEYAARGGANSKGYKFAGSDNVNDVAWYTKNSQNRVQKTGAKDPNELGIYDMSGNIYEWVNDWFGIYQPHSQTDPLGPQSGSVRMARGGCYGTDASTNRVSSRMAHLPDAENNNIFGFRLAMSPGGEPEKGKPKGGRTENKKININTVFVKGGMFKMGCTEEENEYCRDQHLRHEVTLNDFHISKYPVTQKEWYDVMGVLFSDHRDNISAKNTMPGGGEGNDYPMYYVNWDDIQEFIKELNKITGKKYRLPTEAEWEYAARGGVRSNRYDFAGSDDIAEAGWYLGNSGDRFLKKGDYDDNEKLMRANKNRIHTIGGKRPNEIGIFDMTGNVWEWVNDYYDLKYYSVSPRNNPKGPGPEYDEPYRNERVIRGGSWRDDVASCFIFYRRGMSQMVRSDDIGFRLVLPAK